MWGGEQEQTYRRPRGANRAHHAFVPTRTLGRGRRCSQSEIPEARRLSGQLLQDTPRLTHRLSFGPRHAWVAPGTLGTLSGEKNDSHGSCKARFMIPSLTPSPDFPMLLGVPVS